MAEIQLLPESPSRSGLEATYYDSSSTPALSVGTLTSGDQFIVPNDERMFLHVKNGGTAVNLAFDTPETIRGYDIENPTVTVDANEEQFIGPFPIEAFSGQLKFALNSIANVEIAVLGLA